MCLRGMHKASTDILCYKSVAGVKNSKTLQPSEYFDIQWDVVEYFLHRDISVSIARHSEISYFLLMPVCPMFNEVLSLRSRN
jgi:hypothetical protein